MDDTEITDLMLDRLEQRIEALEKEIEALKAGHLHDRALESPAVIARLVERAEEMMGRD